MTFSVSTGFVTDTGQRPTNEDFAGISTVDAKTLASKGLVAAVADGVSTSGAGAEAARYAVRGLMSDYLSTPDTWETSVALDRVLGALNSWLWSQNERAAGTQAMTTTLTALVVRGRRYTVAHLGDSRAWLVRDGQVIPLTRDHARDIGTQHALTRALGLDSHAVIDYNEGELRIGDCFVLATDGAYAHIADEQLAALAGARDIDAQEIAHRLLALAIAARTIDNASVAVVRIDGLAAESLDDLLSRMRDLPIPSLLGNGTDIDGLRIQALIHDTPVRRVYRAIDPRTGERYALKTLHRGRASDAEEIAMLAYEDWITTQPLGRHFVPRAEPPCPPGAHYLLYRWIEGETLEQRLRRDEPLPVADVIAIARQTAEALSQLHRRGIVHRDIKPENLMLCTDGLLRVLDLGVALSGHEPEGVRDIRAGTPSYMNPEQWGSEPPDAGSDVFALGVTLYRLLTRRLPWGEIEPYQTSRYGRDPVSPSRQRPDVPIWLDRLVMRCIARDRNERIATAEEFMLALDRGANRMLAPLPATPLVARDSTGGWRVVAALSLLLNVLLLILLLWMPH